MTLSQVKDLDSGEGHGQKSNHFVSKVLSLFVSGHRAWLDRYTGGAATSFDHAVQTALTPLKKLAVEHLNELFAPFGDSQWDNDNRGLELLRGLLQAPAGGSVGGMGSYFNDLKWNNVTNSSMYDKGVLMSFLERGLGAPANSNPVNTDPRHLYYRTTPSMVAGDSKSFDCFLAMVAVVVVVFQQADFLQLDDAAVGLVVEKCKKRFVEELGSGSLRAKLEAKLEAKLVEQEPELKKLNKLSKRMSGDDDDDDDDDDLFLK